MVPSHIILAPFFAFRQFVVSWIFWKCARPYRSAVHSFPFFSPPCRPGWPLRKVAYMYSIAIGGLLGRLQWRIRHYFDDILMYPTPFWPHFNVSDGILATCERKSMPNLSKINNKWIENLSKVYTAKIYRIPIEHLWRSIGFHGCHGNPWLVRKSLDPMEVFGFHGSPLIFWKSLGSSDTYSSRR